MVNDPVKMNKRMQDAARVTWVGLCVNIVLVVFKMLAGIYGKSGAMIADAIHSLSDFATDVVVLLSFRVVNKPADKTHDYGHGKFETLSTVVIGAMLGVVGLMILYSGAKNIVGFIKGTILYKPGGVAFWAAVVSIISKEALYQYTKKVGQRINNMPIIANAWHHRSDAFSSLAVMIGIGVAILLGERWRILDPIAAVLVSFFILKVGISITMGGVKDLTETSLCDEDENKIVQTASSVAHVKNPHGLKTRKIGNSVAIDIHIEVDENFSVARAHEIASTVEEKIEILFNGDAFVSVHMEPSS